MPSQYHINDWSIVHYHLTLNTLLKCCKNINTWRGQVCDGIFFFFLIDAKNLKVLWWVKAENGRSCCRPHRGIRCSISWRVSIKCHGSCLSLILLQVDVNKKSLQFNIWRFWNPFIAPHIHVELQ